MSDSPCAHTPSTSTARVLSTVYQSWAIVFLEADTEGGTHWDDSGQGREAQGETMKET